MIPKKDLEILSHLRHDARKKVTDISREMKMPVSTVYDKIRYHTKHGLVKRHVTLVDFSKLGLACTALIAMKAATGRREELQRHLESNASVNSLYRINFDHDFLVEVVLSDPGKLQDFTEELNVKFGARTTVYNIISEIKREVLLAKLPEEK